MKPTLKELKSGAGLALAVALLAGAGLRFYHLDLGLPEVVYVDAFKFVNAARDMAASGDWAPRDYQYPGAYTHLLAIIYWITGARSDYAVHLIAQAVAALFGTGLIALTWAAARAACGRGGAALAAALTALSVTFVTLSRIPATDTMLAGLMTTGLWMIARERVGPRQALAAAVCLGLAVGTKFTGLYLGIFMLLAWVVAALRTRSTVLPPRRLALCVAAALLALVITTPWIIPRLAEYARAFAFEMETQRYGQIGRVQLGWADYLASPTITWEQPWLGTSLLYNDGPLILIAAVAGCALALSGRFGKPLRMHAAYAGLYLLLVSRPGHLKAMRFLAPVLPSLYILAAWMLERWTSRAPARWRRALFILAALLTLAVPAYKTLKYIATTRQETTNARAFRWIKANIPQDAILLVSPFFLDNLEGLPQRKLHLPEVGSRQYRIPGKPLLNAELTPIYYPQLIDEVRGLGARYIVTNSYFDDAFAAVAENRRWFPRATANYRLFLGRLIRETTLVYEDLGLPAGRPGPDVRIFRLP